MLYRTEVGMYDSRKSGQGILYKKGALDIEPTLVY
jgi:hypothetical protein